MKPNLVTVVGMTFVASFGVFLVIFRWWLGRVMPDL